MTREEEIKKQADIYTDDASNYAEWSDDGGWSDSNDIELIEKAFTKGAEWADTHQQFSKEEFIEKVSNWLDKHTYDDKYWTIDGDDLFLGNLIDDICKYLEE